MAINFNKIEHTFFGTSCTTSATANETVPAKKIIPDNYTGAYRNKIANLSGEGVYLESADPERDGINFPTSVVEIHATQAQEARVVRLTDTLFVVAHLTAGDDLECYAISVSGTTPTIGDVADVNTADTDSIALCRINDTTFACAYRDEGGSDYLCVRAGTVSGTAITMGTEKELTAAAITEEDLAICYEPTSACVIVAYADGDDDLATIACPLSGTTFGTVGTVVEFDAAAPDMIASCPIQAGYFLVAYSDGGDSSYLHARVASVSTAGAIGTPGTEKTAGVSSKAATLIKAVQVMENTVAVSFLESTTSNDPYIQILTTSGATGTTITAGTAVAVATATASDVSIDMIDNTQGICIFCDDAHGSDVGYAIRFALSGTGSRTVTADSVVDKFVDTSAKAGTLRVDDVACNKVGKCVVIYNDSANDLGCLVGQYYEDRVIDIRSTTTSATYTFDLVPVFEYEKSN